MIVFLGAVATIAVPTPARFGFGPLKATRLFRMSIFFEFVRLEKKSTSEHIVSIYACQCMFQALRGFLQIQWISNEVKLVVREQCWMSGSVRISSRCGVATQGVERRGIIKTKWKSVD